MNRTRPALTVTLACAALSCAAFAGTALFAAARAVAELPPLIPRDVLFAPAQKDAPQISPDGTRLAYLRPAEGGIVNVWVRSLGQDDDVQVTQEEREDLWFFSWAGDSKHLLYLQDRNGDENLHLWSVDVTTRIERDLTPFAGARAQTVLTSPKRPGEVLVGLNIRDPRTFDIHRVDLETGACVLDTENPGDVLGWTADADLQIRAHCAFDPVDAGTTIRVRDATGAPWRDLVRSAFTETPSLGQSNGSSLVLGFSADGRSLYLVDWKNADTTRIVRVDATNGAELETLAQDPECDLWAAFGADALLRYQVLLHPQTQVLQAVAFERAKVKWKALDPVVEGDFAAIQRAVGEQSFTIWSRDREDRLWVVAAFRSDGPTSYGVYERATRRLQPLFVDRPELAKLTLATVEPVSIGARDGQRLLAYLTLPPGVPAKNLPLVLLVHGGPWFRDSWGYDPSVQALANRGYAVLQVQFRGSIGFGKTFLNAGNGQWGVGVMQHDLTDAVRWAVSKGIADPQRVGISGGSYGGYATLAGLAFTPELYACGVDIVGPSNVATLLGSFPPYWAPVKRRWVLRVGDAEADDAFNRRISPLFHVDTIRAPLLIGHGANDPRVKLAESEQIVQALRARNLPVTFVVYPDEGHGFGRIPNARDFMGRMEEFLATHLGGRAEPWRAMEGASAEVR